jgi:hypothetical protein
VHGSLIAGWTNPRGDPIIFGRPADLPIAPAKRIFSLEDLFPDFPKTNPGTFKLLESLSKAGVYLGEIISS